VFCLIDQLVSSTQTSNTGTLHYSTYLQTCWNKEARFNYIAQLALY